MTNERRQLLLKIGAAACGGIFLLDYCIIEPAFHAWSGQTARIATLREKVSQGRQLNLHAASLRERWMGMQRTNLPAEESAAESLTAKALDRWGRDSQVSLTGYVYQWKNREEDDFKTFECRITANGSQSTLGRFLYELESDTTIPVNLEECELSTRDARGGQLTLTARITFLQLKEPAKNPAL